MGWYEGMDVRELEEPRHIRKMRIEIYRKMTPAQRLEIAFDLTEFGRALLKAGLRKLHPEFSEEELHKLYLERLDKAHNREY